MRHQPLYRMNDSQILSAFQDLPPQGAPGREEHALVFDACHVGVILRAVLFVVAVVAAGAMFGTASPLDWLGRTSIVTGGALPATLAWLIAGCSLKKPLARQRLAVQVAAGVGLGALAGLYGCGLLALAGFADPAPWLASASAGALLAGMLVAALVWRVKGRTPAATTARLTELQARIRPHFLFNTLNTAIALVREEPERAESILEDLAELFRHALAEQGASATLTQETELARHYLQIEQARFGERLRVQWQLDEAAGSATLPPLLLQPLVENAVKHGVEPSDSGAEIRISTQRRGTMAVIKVTNTVPAGQGPRGHGLALANVRERLGLLHDLQGTFRTALVDGVYQVRIEVPLPHEGGGAMSLRVLIVDDEALARSRLRRLLGECTAPAAEVAGEAANAADALEWLRRGPVDLALLDIHMPGADGLKLAQVLRSLPDAPRVVFVTAHAQHALQAFEVDAVDYLTKPVRLDRLQAALQKVQRLLPLRPAPEAPDEALVIQERGRTERVPLAEVLYVKAELKYLTVRTAARSYILDGTLNELEDRFGSRFLRVHRNALVARHAVRALEKHHDPEEGDGWALRLQGLDELLAVSRRQLPAVREAIGAA
jgi:two-component system sensor histidine kinase AlgZ